MKIYVKTILFFMIMIQILLPQNIVINEIMASNESTICDGDGEYPDWIELYNNGTQTINLKGYGISDDSEEKFKWIFPAIYLEPGAHQLIFASDKDRVQVTNHWETVIDEGDNFKYRVNDSKASDTWRELNFDDSGWNSGPTGIGYGDNDDKTIIPEGTISFYTRSEFNIDNSHEMNSAFFHIYYDDAFVAYLNGTEIARANITGDNPSFDQTADGATDQEGVLHEFPIDNVQELLVDGENVLAVQVHNHSSTSSDMSFIPFLTFGMQTAPDNPRGTPEILSFNDTFLHTNFKIAADGETLTLVDSTGSMQDQVETGALDPDISYGRKPDGAQEWYLFNDPTPNTENKTSGFLSISEEPVFSHLGGFYHKNINLELSSDSLNTETRYSTDGSIPDKSANLYKGSILIEGTKVIRARAFVEGKIPSKTVTNTYFINKDHDLPVVSLSTTPSNFWDEDSGIYVTGDDYEQDMPHYGANYWEDWERPIHVELYEPNGARGFSIDAGVKIFGGWSRADAQKPLAIFARSHYGYGEIEYQIFPDLPINTFEAFVLRTSANDRPYTMFRDGMMQKLVEGSNIDLQAYRPAAVYLNGEYWGLHNIREKLNEHYVASHHDVDPDDIDLIEGQGNANNGNSEAYWDFYNYIENHDLSNHENYEYLKTQMDIQNFIEYELTQIYYDNTDWPANNLKYWRERSEDGKWRWILYDTDFGFGLYDPGYSTNTLEHATATNSNHWANPPWSTLILRKLLENTEFRNQFINTYADFINTKFEPDRVITTIDSCKNHIKNEIDKHFERWGGSINNWQGNIETLKTFANKRPGFARSHINSKFNLDGTARVQLNVYPKNSGRIKINSITVSGNWSGYYFQGVPIQLEARPAPGYKFQKWSGIEVSESKIRIDPSQDIEATAYFTEASSSQNKIIINEINYNSSDDFDTDDWVELYNNSDTEQDLSGWVFMDSDNDHIFKMPESTIIKADSYLVLCEDQEAFSGLQTDVDNFIGDFDFGLSGGGELIRLYDNVDYLVDSVRYTDDSPWPEAADGDGATLSLKDPNSDNSLPENWEAGASHGTPGSSNNQVAVEDNETKIVNEYKLGQNYPNPFNSSTVIPFQVSEPGVVTINIFDLQGRLVDRIYQARLQPGKSKVNWNCNRNLTSGIYIYQIKIGDSFSYNRKAVLIK